MLVSRPYIQTMLNSSKYAEIVVDIIKITSAQNTVIFVAGTWQMITQKLPWAVCSVLKFWMMSQFVIAVHRTCYTRVYNPFCCFSTSVYYCYLFCYQLSPEAFGYTLVSCLFVISTIVISCFLFFF